MIVSWNWVKQYVRLDMPVAELEQRLMMAGLNHEGTSEVAGDFAIDLEVTSNRPDCLGHLGVAREVAVLWDRQLSVPAANPACEETPVSTLARVTVECPELCPRYTARVIRDVVIRPSPAWLVQRLRTLGIAAINNVVDATNYVLMECGQPLHAFDLDRLEGRGIIVRRARPKEVFEAINHHSYELPAGVCVIADARRAVALGGVMGGAATEVSGATTNLLIESAEFDPLSVRNTARALNLHSDSSYRFERGVDPQGVDWASRRACELILELSGGRLAQGVLDVGQPIEPRQPITLRLGQLPRILGIEIPPEKVQRILTALGNQQTAMDGERIEIVPPTWRRDLQREIDLIEEVARIHGYDAIPEDVNVPMAASARRVQDIALERLRNILTAAGYDEAMTLSAVDDKLSSALSPWTQKPSLRLRAPVLRGADQLRRSIVPSLLTSRRLNESFGNETTELFEIAKVYLPSGKKLPEEPLMLALTSGGDYLDVKGVLEQIAERLGPSQAFEVRACEDPFFLHGRAAEVWLGGTRWGLLGEISAKARKTFGLRGTTTVAEVQLSALDLSAALIPQYEPPPSYPAVTRDLNLIVDEPIRWADLEATVRQSGGKLLEQVAYRETYRSKQLGPGKKSLLLTVTLRNPQGTLRGEQADAVAAMIVKTCLQRHGAVLRS